MSGLPSDFTADDVTKMLSKEVQVENVRMLKKKTMNGSGVAVARLASEEGVRVAIAR